MYKTEMHLHTTGNSYCGELDAEQIIPIYKKAGYDAIICTNHFNKHIFNNYFSNIEGKDAKIEYYLKQYKKLKEIGKIEGIDVFFGLELALGEDNYDNKSRRGCTELLVYGITPEEFVEVNVSICDMSYPEFYDYCNTRGWLVFQAHPYRARTKRIDPKYLHGVEGYNGHPGHIDRNFLAMRRVKKYNLLYSAGSDFHYVGGESTAYIFPRTIKDEKDLVQAIREGGGEILKRKGKN